MAGMLTTGQSTGTQPSVSPSANPKAAMQESLKALKEMVEKGQPGVLPELLKNLRSQLDRHDTSPSNKEAYNQLLRGLENGLVSAGTNPNLSLLQQQLLPLISQFSTRLSSDLGSFRPLPPVKTPMERFGDALAPFANQLGQFTPREGVPITLGGSPDSPMARLGHSIATALFPERPSSEFTVILTRTKGGEYSVTLLNSGRDPLPPTTLNFSVSNGIVTVPK